MKIPWFIKELLIYGACVAFIAFAFCPSTSTSPAPPPCVTVVDLAVGNDESIMQWKAEVARRFPDAVMVVAHGTDIIPGEWFLSDQVGRKLIRAEDEIRLVQSRYPGREVVLVSCNPGHTRLHVHGVAYALADVLMIPEKDLLEAIREFGLPPDGAYPKDAVGNIFEFVED